MTTKIETKDPVLIIDTETTGLRGGPYDRVLEIGICELTPEGRVIPTYNELVRYPDMEEYMREHGPIWVYDNTDMSKEDTLHAKKDLTTVVNEVRDIVQGRAVTSYNVPFDFGKFLHQNPWNLNEISNVTADIMDLATGKVCQMMYDDLIPDKSLQKRLLNEDEQNPGKWIRSLDAYKVLCPTDPAGRDGHQSHRALDDAVMEAYILKALITEGADE